MVAGMEADKGRKVLRTKSGRNRSGWNRGRDRHPANIELAKQAGLQVARGILVDEHC